MRFRIVLGSREFNVANVELLIEVGELLASVLQKEFPIQGERGGKHIYEQDSDVTEDVRRVCPPDGEFEGDEELQLAHHCETYSEHDSDRQKQSVGNHDLGLAVRILWEVNGRFRNRHKIVRCDQKRGRHN